MGTVAQAEDEGVHEQSVTELLNKARALKKSVTAFSDVREFGNDEEGEPLDLAKARRLLEDGSNALKHTIRVRGNVQAAIAHQKALKK